MFDRVLLTFCGSVAHLSVSVLKRTKKKRRESLTNTARRRGKKRRESSTNKTNVKIDLKNKTNEEID